MLEVVAQSNLMVYSYVLTTCQDECRMNVEVDVKMNVKVNAKYEYG